MAPEGFHAIEGPIEFRDMKVGGGRGITPPHLGIRTSYYTTPSLLYGVVGCTLHHWSALILIIDHTYTPRCLHVTYISAQPCTMYEEKGNKRAGHLESQPFVVFVRDSITLLSPPISTSTNVYGMEAELENLNFYILSHHPSRCCGEGVYVSSQLTYTLRSLQTFTYISAQPCTICKEKS